MAMKIVLTIAVVMFSNVVAHASCGDRTWHTQSASSFAREAWRNEVRLAQQSVRKYQLVGYGDPQEQ